MLHVNASGKPLHTFPDTRLLLHVGVTNNLGILWHWLCVQDTDCSTAAGAPSLPVIKHTVSDEPGHKLVGSERTSRLKAVTLSDLGQIHAGLYAANTLEQQHGQGGGVSGNNHQQSWQSAASFSQYHSFDINSPW